MGESGLEPARIFGEFEVQIFLLGWPAWQGWTSSATRWFCHVHRQQNKDIKIHKHMYLWISLGMKMTETTLRNAQALAKRKRSTAAS